MTRRESDDLNVRELEPDWAEWLHLDLGFDPEHAVSVSFDLGLNRHVIAPAVVEV
jgi:hypothetical protein